MIINDIVGTANIDILKGTKDIDRIDGKGGNDTLYGYGGDDALNGGIGADTMIGGIGDDKYWVDNVGDVVMELAGEGTDWVYSSISYTLGANVEYLVLTGSAAINGTGNKLDNVIYGNSAANVLTGGAGNDTLDGMGGLDTLIGGTGDDTYHVDNASVVLIENANEGYDMVWSSVSYTLPANVEQLALTGSALNGIGNALDNIISGTAGDNVLKGGGGDDFLNGGAGTDSLYGGVGDDGYFVMDADAVIEFENSGTDKIYTTISYTLPDNVEILLLQENAANGTGNGLDNDIYGNDVANVLTGGAGDDYLQANNYTAPGGDGFVDTLIGGIGDDTYRVFEAADVVVENANEGRDTIVSSFTYTLSDNNIEDLTLANAGGYIDGTGNGLDNTISGNCFNNTLSGLDGDDVLFGGAGMDTLIGGAGADRFSWDKAADAGLAPWTADTIVDFSFADGDRIDLHNIDADVYAAGDQAFTFIGTAAFSGAPGEIRYYHSAGGDTYIQMQTGTSLDVEGVIRLSGIQTPEASWFVL